MKVVRVGLQLEGRIFPLELSEPLVALAAVADFGLGVPWLVARVLGAGAGTVTAVTYEYGNSFLIVAGLLNFLVMLDAFDIATLLRDEPRSQLRTGAILFAVFVGGAFLAGWLMFPLPL